MDWLFDSKILFFVDGEAFNKRESVLLGFKCSRLCEKFHSGKLQFRIFIHARSHNSKTRKLKLHYDISEVHGYGLLDSYYSMRCGFL